MKFFRYFKGHERKGRWYPVEVGTKEEQIAFESSSYGFCTVLAVGTTKGDAYDPEGDFYYQGPFYIDIDNDVDVGASIKVAKATLKQLRLVGVPEEHTHVWLSGKKGFHIVVPQAVFTDDVPMLDLPHIYRALAKTLGLKDLDYSVYSRQKGRMWRLPSRKRLDNDAYKVYVLPSEVAKLNPKAYKDLCAEPSREYVIDPVKAPVPKLKSLFDFAVAKSQEERPPVTTLIDDNMRNALGDDIMPPCARDLLEGKNIREGKGFNDKSLQMMKAVRAFVQAPDQKSTLEEFARNASGDNYADEHSRLDHVNRSFGSVAGGNDYVWSCRSILAVLNHAPCDNCPLSFLRWQQQDAEDEEIQRRHQAPLKAPSEDSANESLAEVAQQMIDGAGAEEPPAPPSSDGSDEPPKPPEKPKQSKRVAPTSITDTSQNLTIFENCYAFISPTGGFRKVTNFVMKITKVFIEHIANLGEDRRVAVQAEVYIAGKYAGTVNVEEDAWNSNSSFTSAFNGIGNLTFYGKDEDIRRMKSSLLRDIEDTSVNIRRVHSYGVHHAKVAGQDVFTYVEPNWSIDNYGNEDLYSLSGRMTGAPKLKFVEPLVEGQNDPETTLCLTELMSINQRHNVGLLLGWSMAAFFKQHVFAYTNEFPLLSLWGNAEAGKTQTSGLFSALHGIHYVGGTGEKANPASLGGRGTSVFAAWTSMAESMTVPKLFEEFNQRSLGKMYEDYAEHFKKAWNQHAVKRGTIRNAKSHGTGPIDAYTLDIPMTAPAVLIGEQAIDVPALVQRCVTIQLSEEQRRGPGMEEAFNTLKEHYTYLDRFAKTAYMEIINVGVERVKEWVEEWHKLIPKSIGDRPHHSFCVVLGGLSFLRHLNQKYCLGIGDKLEDLIQCVVETTNQTSGEILRRKSFSEIDRMMNELAVMAEISSKADGFKWLPKNQYYMRNETHMYLDGFAAHAQYLRFAVSQQQTPIIKTYASFKDLLRNAKYCETTSAIMPGFARDRQVIKLNLQKMAERGIEIDCFEKSNV